MNTFKKYNGEWVVQVLTGATAGQTVTVTLRSGGTKQVQLGEWVVGAFFRVAPRAAQAPRAAEQVGDLSAIVAMFDRARTHLRKPAIALDGFRVNVAGATAREPGCLTILSVDTFFDARTGRQRRKWLGRVTRAGVYEPGFSADPAIADKLRRFAADPVGEAAAYGRLAGRCCFCNHRLGEGDDRRSVEIGYGPDCADHFGLAWGTRAASAAVAARQDAPAPVASDAPVMLAHPPQEPAHGVA